ncbi:rRNA maturation RNase YbeY [Candidatus Uhrbacteria bacterium]|jgi:probable rRNA maturation factor|nr:rRNA maturation RNase YbeY [Candidatus Uhrbacteria bacterium]
MIKFELNYGRLLGGQRIKTIVVDALMKHAEGILKLKGERNMSIAFVTKSEMTRLNEAYYGGTGVTDVLAFPSEEPHAKSGYLGEILVYYPRAKKQALERGEKPISEVKLLIVHGFLHLLGYDHETPTKKTKMFRLQERILDL